MSLTMTEIARMAKVSQSAVSLVLNGKAAGRISVETQKRILKVVANYNYRPNLAAKGLRQGSVFTIGIIMPAPKNSFQAKMISTFQMKLEERGYMALFSFWQELKTVRNSFESVVNRNVDGLISWEYDECMLAENIPTVLYCQSHPGMDSVNIDFLSAVRQALEYFRELGHVRIGFLGNHHDPRFSAFKKEMLRMGLELRPEWTPEKSLGPEEGKLCMETLLKVPERPSALIVRCDSMVAGALFAAYKAGVRIPHDISLISFDNSINSGFLLPPLTTFASPVETITDSFIDLVLSRIQNPDRADVSVTIRPELCLRESCCRYHVNLSGS